MMHPKFHTDQNVNNRNTRESGVVRNVYKKNGKTMYEVSVPAHLSIHGIYASSFVCRSDWTEDVLELAPQEGGE